MKSGICSAAIAALALLAAAPLAGAQNYPTRPVRVIVTFPAGSATDILGRIVAAKLTELWGHQVVVDNRGGAGGSIGSAIGARATPDGHTLIINSSAHTVNPALYYNLAGGDPSGRVRTYPCEVVALLALGDRTAGPFDADLVPTPDLALRHERLVRALIGEVGLRPVTANA